MTMHISSAGGDSPKINYVRDLDMHVEDYENLLELEVEKKVKEILGLLPQDTSPITAKKPKKGALMAMLERDLGTRTPRNRNHGADPSRDPQSLPPS